MLISILCVLLLSILTGRECIDKVGNGIPFRALGSDLQPPSKMWLQLRSKLLIGHCVFTLI